MTEENTSNQIEQPQQSGKAPSLHGKSNVVQVHSADGANESAMQGFDPKFGDIVDYILKITNEIWEERGIGRLYDYYSTDIRVHTSDGDIYTREKVIEGTIQAMAAFPDRRLIGEEVIWTGDDKDGYYTSHRLTHEGHNWGHTIYGPPTGSRVRVRAIAE